MRRGWLFAGTIGAALLASAAHAEPAAKGRAMRLDYQPATDVASACPSEAAFRLMVQLFTRDKDPFVADAAETLRVTLARRGTRFHVTVAAIGKDGTQRGAAEEDEAATCSDAAMSAAETAFLVTAPKVVPPAGTATGASADPVPSGQPPAAPNGSPSPRPSAPTPAAPWAPPPLPRQNFEPLLPSASGRPWYMDLTIGLSAYALMSLGFTSNVGGGFGIGGDVRGDYFSLGLELRGVLPSTVHVVDPIDPAKATYTQDMDVSLWSAQLVPCGRWWYLVGCGVVQASMIVFQTDTFDSDIAFGLGPRLGFEIPLGERFALFGFGEVMFALNQRGVLFDLPPPGEPSGPIGNVKWGEPIVRGFIGAGGAMKFK